MSDGASGPAAARVGRALDAVERASSLNAFLSVDAAGAGAAAWRLDEAAASGDAPGPLHGLVVAVKDNLCTVALPTTCGSRILDGYHSPYEATAVRRVRAAGGIVLGKTNLDEFAMGSSTEHSVFGATRNPHDPGRVPGGSSGGSAAAVAAGVADVALGSDTGGSVRQPAAFCGVVGIRPTYGRVSRYGLVAFASSMDQVGTIGRTVESAARLLQVVSGPDPRDATCGDAPVPDLTAAARAGRAGGVEGLVVGIPAEYRSGLEAGVEARFSAVTRLFEAAGAELRELSLPHTAEALPAYCVLAPAEAASNLARYDGVRFGRRPADGSDDEGDLVERTRSRGFGTEARRRILLGTYVLSAGHRERYYARACRARARVAADFMAAFASGVDVLLTPTTPTPAFPLGSRTGDPVAMYAADVFTTGPSLAGLPCLSVPMGRIDGLPVGAQLVAPPWAEADLVRAAAGLESLGIVQ